MFITQQICVFLKKGGWLANEGNNCSRFTPRKILNWRKMICNEKSWLRRYGKGSNWIVLPERNFSWKMIFKWRGIRNCVDEIPWWFYIKFNCKFVIYHSWVDKRHDESLKLIINKHHGTSSLFACRRSSHASIIHFFKHKDHWRNSFDLESIRCSMELCFWFLKSH